MISVWKVFHYNNELELEPSVDPFVEVAQFTTEIDANKFASTLRVTTADGMPHTRVKESQVFQSQEDVECWENNQIKKKALAKLTDREKEVLGL